MENTMKTKNQLPPGVLPTDLMEGEILKPIKGYKGLYSISNMGGIYSHPKNNREGKWIRQCNRVYEYIRIGLSKNGRSSFDSMHRLVAKAFVPNPDNKSYVNHKDGDKTNCRADNLEWVTSYENMQHSADTGLNPRMKLSIHDKYDICESYISGKMTYKELAELYTTRESNIRRYVKNYERMKIELPRK
jgi:hypothetical protein